MSWIAILTACVVTFLLGYDIGNIKKNVRELTEVVKTKVDKKPEVKEVESELIDLTDEVQNAIFEHNRMMKKMNPDE